MDRRKHFQWSSVVLQWTLLLSALLAASATFAQTASTISSASVAAVRSRVYATGSGAPAFTIGNSTSVDAVHNGNFWIPDFPTGGSGTLTVDVLFSTNAAITLGSVTDLAFAMGYGASNNWPGVTAKVITSTDGATVTVLNTLSGSMDASAPNQLRHYSGSVTGAGAALWFGVRFQTVPISYPFIFGNLQLQTAGGTVLNGSCGSANGVARATAPSANLCAAGTASAVTGAGPWNWTCAGSGGGSNATCSAPLLTYTVTATASPAAGGTITCANPVTGGNTTTCTATPASGYATQSISGCGGTATAAGVNSYTTGTVNANCTVTATFAATTGGGQTITSGSVTGVRSRVYATGSSAPAFTIGDSTSVDAVHNGNFWIPDFPTGGSGTLTVDVLFSTNAAITLGSVTDLAFAMGYGASNNWPGVTAKVITSTDGTTVTVLNTLSGNMDASAPNQLRHYSGSVTGAGAALWFGVRFQTVPISYPFIFGNLQLQTAGGTVLNGSCGSANGVARTTAPSANLCAAGTASAVTGAGPWSWTCAGSGGGSNATCSAPLLTYTVSATASPAAGGTITCANPVTGGNTTTCTATPASGYATQSINGCGGTATAAGVNTYTTGVVNANCAVTAAFVLQSGNNGACGSANGVPTSAAPTSNLCSAGTPSAVTGTGPWNWNCAGTNGGSTATCSAPKTQGQTVVPTTGLITANAQSDQTAMCSPASGSFPQQWTWSSNFTANPRDAIPADNLQPRIEQHRKVGGSDTIVAIWKSFSSNPDTCSEIFRSWPTNPAPVPPYTSAVIYPYTPAELQQMADSGCGPFGNVPHVDLFRLWLPGDVFLVYPAVYTGTNNNITLHPQSDYYNGSQTPIFAPNNITIQGVTQNGIRPTILRNSGGAGDTETYKSVVEIVGGSNVTVTNLAIALGGAPDAYAAQSGVYLLGAGYNNYDANGNELANPQLGPPPNTITLSNLHIHGFQFGGGNVGANGIFGDATGGGTVVIANNEIDHNGSPGTQGSAGIAHGVYMGASANQAAFDPNYKLVFQGNWFHDQVFGHHAKSRAQNTTYIGNYFQGGVPQGNGFDTAENFLADVPNGGALIARYNIFAKNASGPDSNGFSLTYATEGIPNDGPNGQPRPNSIDVQFNTFVAFTKTYDGVHPVAPLLFFYPGQSPADAGFPVSNVTVANNAFVGYCSVDHVQDYRGTTQLIAGFGDLSQVFSFGGKFVAPTFNVSGQNTYSHQSLLVPRQKASIGAED